MLAWEWTLEKARDGEGEVEKKATTTRKISQTAQVEKEEEKQTQNSVFVKLKQPSVFLWGSINAHLMSSHLITSSLSSGYLWSESRLQPSANRHRRNGLVQRTAGMYFSFSLCKNRSHILVRRLSGAWLFNLFVSPLRTVNGGAAGWELSQHMGPEKEVGATVQR